MRRLVCAIALCAASALAIPPAVVGNVPGRRVKLEVSDNFNRANGALVANWTSANTYVLSISSNVVIRSGAGSGWSIWNANTMNADQFSEALLSKSGAPNSSVGVYVRASSPVLGQFNSYSLVRSGSLGTFTLDYFYWNGATVKSTTLASCPGFPSTGSVIARIEAIGTSIKGYELSAHGGTKTERCSATHAALSAGQPAIGAGGQYGGGEVDNWYGGDL